MKKPWKVGIIGGTGRIGCGIACELVRNRELGRGSILLHGRSAEKMRRNLTLIERVGGAAAAEIKVAGSDGLDDAVRGADVVICNATPGLEESGGYSAFGILNGAYILHLAQQVAKLAPEAWLMVDVNPPDVPLIAAHRKFGLRRVMGLCNSTDLFQQIIAAYLGCAQEDISLSEIGVNHEVYYLDILRKGVSVYDELRRTLPTSYHPEKVRSPYLDACPEWPIAFRNNISILEAIGFLTSPVGGPGRFRGLPVPGAETAAMVKKKQPSDEDFQAMADRNAKPEEIMEATWRRGGALSLYVGRVISALLSETPARESVLVLNDGILPDQPETALLQVNCRISRGGVEAPKGMRLPDYVSAVLASRIRQNVLAARALAEQDEALLRQAMLACPERVELSVAARVAHGRERADPHMQLN